MSRDRAKDGPAEGLALIDKPAGVTSFQVLGSIKRTLDTGRVGHTGTLDRFATGLIVALIGRLTRLAPLLSGQGKCYRARVRFGEETTTLDPEGEVVATAPPPTAETLAAVLPRFVGEQDQVPPAFSAVHHEGERAYVRALRGETPELRPRRVLVSSLELLDYQPPLAELRVECSAGTYVRSLARDLALACDSRATVVELERTSVGPFEVAEAVAPEDFAQAHLLSPAVFLPRIVGLVTASVQGRVEARLASGGLPAEGEVAPWPAGARLQALFGSGDRLLAVLERTPDGGRRFMAVFPPGAGGIN